MPWTTWSRARRPWRTCPTSPSGLSVTVASRTRWATLAAGTSGAGEAFFQSIVLRLARALRVRYASVAELVDGDRARTVARCIDGRLVDNVEYPLAGTPCASVLEGAVCYVRDGVAEAFPEDEGLRVLRARTYVGAALRSSTGRPMGLVNAIHERPLDEVVRPEAVMQVFASRAAAELERRNAEVELERQRVFAESLLDMVASLVLVVDPEGRIVRFNRACETTSGWDESGVRGATLLGGPVATRSARGGTGRVREPNRLRRPARFVRLDLAHPGRRAASHSLDDAGDPGRRGEASPRSSAPASTSPIRAAPRRRSAPARPATAR